MRRRKKEPTPLFSHQAKSTYKGEGGARLQRRLEEGPLEHLPIMMACPFLENIEPRTALYQGHISCK